MASSDLYLHDKPTQELSDLYSSYVDNQNNVRLIQYKNNIEYSNKQYSGSIDKTKITFAGVFSKEAKVGYIDGSEFKEIPVK